MESVNPTFFGLLATAILLTTLCAQTIKQWREHATRGIARWFFLGQVSASVCFVIYSVLIHSTLFAVANALILASALAGYIVLRVNRSRALRNAPDVVVRSRMQGADSAGSSHNMQAPHGRVAVL
jgi:uncharacterized protein with PQ loop repeat